MTARTKWIAAIVGLLLANVLACIALATAAHEGGASKIVPGYEDNK
jgi:hypothetical protein